jgi:hypothetical protein
VILVLGEGVPFLLHVGNEDFLRCQAVWFTVSDEAALNITVAVEGWGKFIKMPLDGFADFDLEAQEWKVVPSPDNSSEVDVGSGAPEFPVLRNARMLHAAESLGRALEIWPRPATDVCLVVPQMEKV